MNNLIGVVWIVAGGFLGATYLLGLKHAKPWSWENIWLIYSVFALIVLPFTMVAINVPKPVEALALAPRTVLLKILLLGAGWGVGAALSGLGVDRVGIGLGMSLLVGTAAAFGTLTPLIIKTPELLFQPKGLVIITSVIILAAGVALVAAAGKERERATKEHHEAARKGSFLAGLLICIFGGIFASMLNLALSFSQPVADAALQTGADRGGAENLVWMVILGGGFVVNAVYTIMLLSRNHTWKTFAYPGSGRAALAGFLMALFWYFDAVLYGHGTHVLGKLGTVAGWPVFVSSMMIFSCMWGFVTGEWRRANQLARWRMLAGVIVLVCASGISMLSKMM